MSLFGRLSYMLLVIVALERSFEQLSNGITFIPFGLILAEIQAKQDYKQLFVTLLTEDCIRYLGAYFVFGRKVVLDDSFLMHFVSCQ